MTWLSAGGGGERVRLPHSAETEYGAAWVLRPPVTPYLLEPGPSGPPQLRPLGMVTVARWRGM